jgi:hypothetical protein
MEFSERTGGNNSASHDFAQGNDIETAGERRQKPDFSLSDEIYGY